MMYATAGKIRLPGDLTFRISYASNSKHAGLFLNGACFSPGHTPGLFTSKRGAPSSAELFRQPERQPYANSAGDATVAMTAIANAVACGEVTPPEALDLSRLVESYVKTIEVCDLEKRLQVLEARLAEEKVQ
jgi:hypothetical protein